MSTDTQTLDIPKVSAYLEKHLEGFEGPLEVSKFQAGQSNPTFLLKTPSRNYVLRRKRRCRIPMCRCRKCTCCAKMTT